MRQLMINNRIRNWTTVHTQQEINYRTEYNNFQFAHWPTVINCENKMEL